MAELARYTTVRALQRASQDDPELVEAMRQDPIGTLRKVGAAVPNNQVYRMAVWIIGAALLVSLVGAIIMMLRHPDQEVPAILVSTASAAIGVIAGMLAPQPVNDVEE